MIDRIGNVDVPEMVVTGTFPIITEYPYGRATGPDLAIHTFGSGNAKIEQRFLLGTAARRFTIRKNWLHDGDRIALRNFWESNTAPTAPSPTTHRTMTVAGTGGNGDSLRAWRK